MSETSSAYLGHATRTPVIACHECDLLQRESTVPPEGALRCCRCRATLYRRHANSLDRTLAYALAACVLWIVSNAFPIVGLSVNGDLVETTLFGAVRVLYRDGMWPLSALIFTTTMLMPACQALGLVWLLLPLRLGRTPYRADAVFRSLRVAQEWGMTEVLILGLLVALVKLAHIASVVTGPSLWSFGALMLLLAAAASAFDARDLWSRLQGVPDAGPAFDSDMLFPAETAAACGLCVCHDCGLLTRAAPAQARDERDYANVHAAVHVPTHATHCPRCGAHLHLRKPDSLARTWACLIAAIILYIPANVLPVMDTSSLFGAQKDTIMSGVVYLWTSGSWPLAVLVFIASIAVPMLKILAISFLAISANFRSTWQPDQRARIYRLVELVGRWSMLDIYVIAVLTALVQFNALATVRAGPAAIAFGAVVVLTMFAAMSFDPRLIWDARKTE
ncbi:paraquat-inducible protein A [Paraburkholderia hospita]|jgi:paraquat-inducible protein A|uniref:paraquat-inducible protein A n=1 Tax=Paraburkholderia hospita TaxID=169430 RepID=UPI000271CFF8|nr:paraquat-inducible protein A [Paraburkholderia hospita]EUC17413.1 integral membrane protein, PqiA family [Burkholderia sp. BT03]SKC70827.1 integral membrane protein, PqiA family [Burkholderia sp. CF099]SKC78250.1 integral membrane protein, PqiA family [Paraburkholderia hospita]SKC97313.1 integral membrane protein, PqiA family [Paraburkholderia hospita]